MKREFDGAKEYRQKLARDLFAMRTNGGTPKATDKLSDERKSLPYRLSRLLHRDATPLLHVDDGEVPPKRFRGAGERSHFGYYRSNEYYRGLADELRHSGGVGLAVGSDQGLDFMIMAGLKEVYIVDIDPYTHIFTLSYLEAGTRFRKLHHRYPTVDEFIHMFKEENVSVTLNMLALPSTLYNFKKSELTYFINHIYDDTIVDYLKQKHKWYDGHSWISTDRTLRETISAYEQGRIHVCQGDIRGKVVPKISQEVRKKHQTISLIYTSNAPIKKKETLQIFSQLPVNGKTRVICSNGYFISGMEYVRPPTGYRSLSWSFIVFHLLDADEWPEPCYRDGREFQEIAQGCYKWRKVT